MSSDVQHAAWKRYLKCCEQLECEPEATVPTNLLQRYKTLYSRYCKYNDLQFDPSANLDYDVDIQKLSKVLYLLLCGELGYESIIQIRRTIAFLKEHVHNQIYSDRGYLLYHHVGSRADGFRITTSDIDHMFVLTDNVVVYTTEISKLPFAKSNTIITMETRHTKPGYVRLILETDKYMSNDIISKSCLSYDDKCYISSTKFREITMSFTGKKLEVHGPCTTINYAHPAQDTAFCLPCTSQLSAVHNWETRCNEHNWPDSAVLKQCIIIGCQLAPVGSKKSEHEYLEWRISFILMERAISLSLSHSQFMCYGLLKIYLKEVLNSFEEINDLVSSYFMKTVLLWEIQTNSQRNVGGDSLLQVFRNCLQRLHTWVKTENCPNFFIPENNLFENRIYGQSRHTLQNILELLLTEKFYGLYRCQSIDLPYLIYNVLIIEKQSVVLSVDEHMYVTDKDIETQRRHEINAQFYTFQPKESSIADLNTILRTLELFLTKDSLTDLEKIAVKTWIIRVTICITIHNFKDIIALNDSPDIDFEEYNSCCATLRSLDQKGGTSLLYLATLMYLTDRYQSCLDVIMEINKRLKEEIIMMVYVSVILQLTELRLELESTFYRKLHGDIEDSFLYIDPCLYVSMLSVLCHYHLGDVEGTEIEFQLLRKISSDRSYIKTLSLQEISWQILGICAEIIGKYDEAYQSYVRAYNSPRGILRGNAPKLRVLCLIYKLLQKKILKFT